MTNLSSKKLLLFVALLFVFSISCKSDDNGSDTQTEICSNGIDDDNDGFVDCEDNDCSASNEIECECSDGIDNDADGFTDDEDSDCP